MAFDDITSQSTNNMRLEILLANASPRGQFMEEYVVWDTTSVLKAERAVRPGVRFRHSSAILRKLMSR